MIRSPMLLLLLLGPLLFGTGGMASGTTLQEHAATPRPNNFSLVRGRLMFPLEISVPDLINGVLSAFRFFWTRFQWLFGISDTTIVGAKDPPSPPPHFASLAGLAVPTPSPALKAVPLAPEPVFCSSPVSTVSVEVDDPVRHPYLHKPKTVRRKRRKKRRRKRIQQAAIDWDMVALEAWSLL